MLKTVAIPGVIGGSSAGAAFQGDIMIRGNAVPNDLSILLDPDHLEGFAYATGVGFVSTVLNGLYFGIFLIDRLRYRTRIISLAVGWTTTLSSA